MVEEADVYLVWSNEHRGWWKPDGWGYTKDLAKGGRFARAVALQICRNAIPTAMHLGMISEIPLRLADVEEFLKGQMIPKAICGGET